MPFQEKCPHCRRFQPSTHDRLECARFQEQMRERAREAAIIRDRAAKQTAAIFEAAKASAALGRCEHGYTLTKLFSGGPNPNCPTCTGMPEDPPF